MARKPGKKENPVNHRAILISERQTLESNLNLRIHQANLSSFFVCDITFKKLFFSMDQKARKSTPLVRE